MKISEELMQELQKIPVPDDTVREFRAMLERVENQKGVFFGGYINILEWARKFILPDAVYEGEAASLLYDAHGGSRYREMAKNTAFELGSNETLEGMVVTHYEPDEMAFQMVFEEPLPERSDATLRLDIAVILVWMLSDCTGCCNAFKFMNLSHHGIYAEADVHMTYHS